MPIAEHLYDQVKERARTQPELVDDVLRALADLGHILEVDDDRRRLAARLVDVRAGTDLAAFRRRGLTTNQVTQIVAGLHDRRSVEARRRRGKLLGLTIGRETYHPDWQFAAGRTRPRLEEVLAALLPAAGGEPVAADVVFRAPRDELDGASLADVYAAGRTEEVLAYLRMRTGGFTG